METINNTQLSNESVYPDEPVLKKVLGRTYTSYCALLELFDKNQMVFEWKYYRDGKAWLCKVQKKKRTIVWMSAWKGYMQATVYIPDKHLHGIFNLRISEKTRERIRETKNVGKSKPCIFEIRNQRILKDLDAVIQYKILMK